VDLGFRSLTLSDVTVDQNEAATRYSIATDFDDPTIWPYPFQPQFPVSLFEASAEFRFDVVGAKLAAIGKDAKVLSIARTLRQNGIG
jgi:hypothetical protein